MKKRVLSLFLCAAMLISLLALPACSSTTDDHDHDDAQEVIGITDEGTVPLEETPTDPVGETDPTPAPAGGENDAGKEEPSVKNDPPTEQTSSQDQTAPNEGPKSDPVPPAEETSCSHDWKMTGSEVTKTDCIYGDTWVAYETCTKCGARRDVAYRPSGAATGSHKYVTVKEDKSCPDHVYIEEKCSVCGNVKITPGGHNWSAWSVSNGNPCTESYTETRTCSYCGKSETRTQAAMGHSSWRIVSETKATCTDPAKVTKTCNRCGETVTVESGAALGHQYQSLSGDCAAERQCTRCGAKVKGLGHTYGDTYSSNASGHWQVCKNCGQGTDIEPHRDSGNGKCVCGYKVKSDPSNCSHNWTILGSTSTFTHKEECTKCGATRSVNCSQSSFLLSRTYCTDRQYCQCGNVAKEAQKNHNFGTWICNDSTHQHKCLNIGCQFVSNDAHSYQTASGGVKRCSVCGHVDSKSMATHTHVWGAWTSSGSGGHSRACTVPGCTAIQSAGHSLGAANCKGEAVCKDCGATITGKAGSTHVGGTEIRDAKPAEEGAEGYTGDTYCLGCGKKIASGSVIPALPASHTHSYEGGWVHDSKSHWHACSCGEVADTAAHSFKDGKCTVCGEADPDYHAPDEEHVHSFDSAWSGDDSQHWHTCAVCGEKTDVDTHTFEDGKCLVCGKVDPAVAEKHEFTAWTSDGPNTHSRTCTVSGCTEKETELHKFVDGKCTVCGASRNDEPNQPNEPEAHHHTFVDGTCTGCGAKEPAQFEYRFNFDNMEFNGTEAVVKVDVLMNGKYITSIPVTINLA